MPASFQLAWITCHLSMRILISEKNLCTLCVTSEEKEDLGLIHTHFVYSILNSWKNISNNSRTCKEQWEKHTWKTMSFGGFFWKCTKSWILKWVVHSRCDVQQVQKIFSLQSWDSKTHCVWSRSYARTRWTIQRVRVTGIWVLIHAGT